MPRKSNVSQISAAGEDGTPAKDKDGVNIEDLSLPRSMVQRLAKGVLPPNTQIQKDAITAMSKGATVFVNHIADKANEITLTSNRKTISPTAVLEALAECEFADFLPRVEAELKRFNEIATGKRNEYRRKVKEKESGTGGKSEGSTDGETGAQAAVNGAGGDGAEAEVEAGGGDGERASKRMRRDEGDEARFQGQLREPTPSAQLNGAMAERDVEVDGEGRDATNTQAIDEDEGGEGEDDDEDKDEDELEEDDEEEDEASEGAGSVGSGMDMDARLRGLQDGVGSGVDETESEESD